MVYIGIYGRWPIVLEERRRSNAITNDPSLVLFLTTKRTVPIKNRCFRWSRGTIGYCWWEEHQTRYRNHVTGIDPLKGKMNTEILKRTHDTTSPKSASYWLNSFIAIEIYKFKETQIGLRAKPPLKTRFNPAKQAKDGLRNCASVRINSKSCRTRPQIDLGRWRQNMGTYRNFVNWKKHT